MRNLSPKLLKADQRGLAAFLKREGEQLPDRQYVRELVQNAFDANATRVLIDIYHDGESPKLRFSDDGDGMSDTQLEEHLSTLHRSGHRRGVNFGVGARLATLSRNPLGVMWASTQNHRSGQVHIAEGRDGYTMMPYDTEDGEQSYVFAPDPGILPDFVTEAGHGTSVVLLGSKTRPASGTQSVISNAATYLSNRYWRFPDGASVMVTKMDGSSVTQKVWPTRDKVLRDAQAKGAVRVQGEVPATVEWYLLSPSEERRYSSGRSLSSMLVVRHEDELFECPDASRMWAAFGIPLRSARSRLVLVVEPDAGVAMNTNRTYLVRPRGRGLPWLEWARQFAEQLPAEIAHLMEQLKPRSTLDQDLLDRLGNWQQKVQRTSMYRPAPTGEKRVAAAEQLAPKRVEVDGEEHGQHEQGERPTPAPRLRQASAKPGDQPAEEIKVPDMPQVVWIAEAEWDLLPFWVNYDRGTNVLYLLESTPFVRAEVESRVVETGLPESVVVSAVQDAYGVEAAFKVLHILCLDDLHSTYRWSEHQINEALSPGVLSAAITGMNAVGAEIEKKMKQLMTRGEL